MKAVIIQRIIHVVIFASLICVYQMHQKYREIVRCHNVNESNKQFILSTAGGELPSLLQKFNKIDNCN
jgi:hypothetical protein